MGIYVNESSRRKVKNEPRGVIAAVIEDKYGNILIQDHVKYNILTIPVGKVDPGEDFEDALHREMWEELGITDIKFKKISEFRESEGGEWIVRLYKITKYKGTPKNIEPEKHRSLEFMSVDDLLEVPNRGNALNQYLIHIGAL